VRTDEKPRSILKQNSPGKYRLEEGPGSEYTLVVNETPKAGLKVDNAFLITVDKEPREETPVSVEDAEEAGDLMVENAGQIGDLLVEKEFHLEKPVSVEVTDEVGDLMVENAEQIRDLLVENDQQIRDLLVENGVNPEDHQKFLREIQSEFD
jgi:hypothetical protein